MRKIIVILTLLLTLTACNFSFQSVDTYELKIEDVEKFISFMNTDPNYNVTFNSQDKLYDIDSDRTYLKYENKAKLIDSCGIDVLELSDVHIFDGTTANRYFYNNEEAVFTNVSLDHLVTAAHDYVGYAYFNAINIMELTYQKCLNDLTINANDFKYDNKTSMFYYYSEKYINVMEEYIENFKTNYTELGISDADIAIILMSIGLYNIDYNSSKNSLLSFKYDIIDDEIVSATCSSNLGQINYHWQYRAFNSVLI